MWVLILRFRSAGGGEMAAHTNILTWNPMDQRSLGATVHEGLRVDTVEAHMHTRDLAFPGIPAPAHTEPSVSSKSSFHS